MLPSGITGEMPNQTHWPHREWGKGVLVVSGPLMAWWLDATTLVPASALSVLIQEKNEAPADLQGLPTGSPDF